MKKKSLVWLAGMIVGVMLMAGCGAQTGETPPNGVEDGGAEAGTLAFVANGEDFVRQGFTSKDGWAIDFDHVYVSLAEVTAYQTDPPYDPENGTQIEAKQSVALEGIYTVDLAEGDEEAAPIPVGSVEAPAGHYNAISWKMTNAAQGVAQGNNVVIIGKAEKDGKIIDFTIKIDRQFQYSAGEFVGDERKGIVASGQEADLEMTFHFDHIFGDAGTPADDGLNAGALGFEPIARLARDGKVELDKVGLKQGLTPEEYDQWLAILPTLGHVGEGHAHAEEI